MRLVSATVAILVLAASASATPDYAKLAARCMAGKEKDCQKLMDEALEARPADRERARAELAPIARAHPSTWVRERAVRVVRDPELLLELALAETDEYVVPALIDNETLWVGDDPARVSRIATEAQAPGLRYAATSRLTDQALLEELARSATSWPARGAALRRLEAPAAELLNAFLIDALGQETFAGEWMELVTGADLELTPEAAAALDAKLIELLARAREGDFVGQSLANLVLFGFELSEESRAALDQTIVALLKEVTPYVDTRALTTIVRFDFEPSQQTLAHLESLEIEEIGFLWNYREALLSGLPWKEWPVVENRSALRLSGGDGVGLDSRVGRGPDHAPRWPPGAYPLEVREISSLADEPGARLSVRVQSGACYAFQRIFDQVSFEEDECPEGVFPERAAEQQEQAAELAAVDEVSPELRSQLRAAFEPARKAIEKALKAEAELTKAMEKDDLKKMEQGLAVLESSQVRLSAMKQKIMRSVEATGASDGQMNAEWAAWYGEIREEMGVR